MRKYKFLEKWEIDFILKQRLNLTVSIMATVLNRKEYTIRGFLQRNKLDYFKVKDKHIFDLTPKEEEIIKYFAFADVEIAKRLNLAVTTIKTHRNNIYQKLQAHNGAEAIVKALKKGFITVDDLEVA